MSAPEQLRCHYTKNPCGTDTWGAGNECGWWFCFAEDISENIERSIRKNFNPTAYWSSYTAHFAGNED